MAKIELFDAEGRVLSTVDGPVVERSQIISHADIDHLRDERNARSGLKTGDWLKVASVPTIVWERWDREGRDPANATSRQIVKWLREENLDYFIATDKTV